MFVFQDYQAILQSIKATDVLQNTSYSSVQCDILCDKLKEDLQLWCYENRTEGDAAADV